VKPKPQVQNGNENIYELPTNELTQNDTDWGGGMASLSISQEIPSLNFHL
jgi:hypothetical protein